MQLVKVKTGLICADSKIMEIVKVRWLFGLSVQLVTVKTGLICEDSKLDKNNISAAKGFRFLELEYEAMICP